MEVEELQRKVIEFRDSRDWAQYHNPKDLAISLSLEAAELLEVFQWKDAREVEAIKSAPEGCSRVKEELGDILIYALNMCHAFGFEPSEVVLEKLALNEKKYPVENARGSEKVYGVSNLEPGFLSVACNNTGRPDERVHRYH